MNFPDSSAVRADSDQLAVAGNEHLLGSSHRQAASEALPAFTSVDGAVHADVVEHVDCLVRRILRIEHHLARWDVRQVRAAPRAVERRPGLAKIGGQEHVSDLVRDQGGVVRHPSGETRDKVNLSVHRPGQEILRRRREGNRTGTPQPLIVSRSNPQLGAVSPLHVDVGNSRAPVDAYREISAARYDLSFIYAEAHADEPEAALPIAVDFRRRVDVANWLARSVDIERVVRIRRIGPGAEADAAQVGSAWAGLSLDVIDPKDVLRGGGEDQLGAIRTSARK